MPTILEVIRDFFRERLGIRKKVKRKADIRKQVKELKRYHKIKRSMRIKTRFKRRIPKRSFEIPKTKVLEQIKPKSFIKFNVKSIQNLFKKQIKLPSVKNFPPSFKPQKLKFPAHHVKSKAKPKALKQLYVPKSITKKKVAQKIPKEAPKEVIAADVMSTNVRTVRPDDTLNYVVRLFADKKISGAPVIKGSNLVGIIGESDIVKFVGSKELLSTGSSGLKFLSEIKVEEVMHKNPVFVYEYTKLSEAADVMNKFDITRLPVLNERRDLVGIITRSDMMRGISKELLFKLLEKHEVERVLKVETDIDEILQVVERKGSIGMAEMKKKLMLPEDKIEEWGKILERHDLIELFYPPIGKPEFRKKIK